jgi:hypothetical protein
MTLLGQYHIDCLPEYDTDVCSCFLVKSCLLNVLIFQVERQGRQKDLEIRSPLTLNLKSSKFLAFTLMPNLTTDFGTQSVISLERKAKNINVDASFALYLVIKETMYICLHASRLPRLSKRNPVMFQSFHVIIWRR